MNRITPHLWFDKEAREAAAFYTSVFAAADSRVIHTATIHDTPSGDADIVTIELFGQEFQLLNGGPLFKFTPAISFLVACRTREEVDAYWAQLAAGGSVLMELGEYPFSPRYGWVQDRYGLSWQLSLAPDGAQRITPMLLFTGGQAGKAEEAIRFYASLFPRSRVGDVFRYGPGEEPEREGTVRYAAFTLAGQEFAAMDSARAHRFSFNEAISLMAYCDTQAEIDRYWDSLTAVPEAEACGWLKDRYGLSWQIVPTEMDAMLKDDDPQRRARVTQAFLKMKKFDLAALRRAYEGEKIHSAR